MASCVGIDLSSFSIDLVKLDENTNAAEWVRCELAGDTAWERTLTVRDALAGDATWDAITGYWDDVYLVAIETPVNDQRRILSRVQGAILASLPAKLRQPHCCWEVHPSTWKAGLGLKGKPDNGDMVRLAPEWGERGQLQAPYGHGLEIGDTTAWQNARDAYCIAKWARDTNARAVEKALTA